MIAPRSFALLLEELNELVRTRDSRPSRRLARLHRQLALVHIAIADELDLERPALALAERAAEQRRSPKVELATGDEPEPEPSDGDLHAGEHARPAPQAKRRKGVRPVYRPQGPVDEVSAKRADIALRRAGLLPVAPRRK